MARTNERLRHILTDREMTVRQLADTLNVPFNTARNWTRSPSAAGYRSMPTTAMELLELKIEQGINIQQADKEPT